jgi:uncharacterized protein YodC (DUF2158 family)
MLFVRPIGSKVFIGEKNDIPAVITAIFIKENNHVTYQCSWWKESIHYSEYFEEFELVCADTTRKKIGFKQ